MTEVREKVLLVFDEKKDTVAIDFNCPFIGQDPCTFFRSLKNELEKLGVELEGPSPVERMLDALSHPEPEPSVRYGAGAEVSHYRGTTQKSGGEK